MQVASERTWEAMRQRTVSLRGAVTLPLTASARQRQKTVGVSDRSKSESASNGTRKRYSEESGADASEPSFPV